MSKKQIFFLIGPSGSGKSTWAANYIKEHWQTARINRDDIRKTLVGNLNNYWNRNDVYMYEALTNSISVQYLSILSAKSLNIIIDNTNLTSKEINSLLSLIDLDKYEIKFLIFKSEVNECKKRVSLRDNINTDYIDKHFKRFEQIVKWIKEYYPDNFEILN